MQRKTRNRRKGLAVLAGVGLFGAVSASAAGSIGVHPNQDGVLAVGESGAALACDDYVGVDYHLGEDNASVVVTSVTIKDVAGTCAGETLFVDLIDVNGDSVVRASALVAAAGDLEVSFPSYGVPASDIDHVKFVIG